MNGAAIICRGEITAARTEETRRRRRGGVSKHTDTHTTHVASFVNRRGLTVRVDGGVDFGTLTGELTGKVDGGS